MFLFLIEAAYLLQFKENCIEVAKKLINADAIKATEKLFVLRRSTTEVHVTLTGLIYFVMPKARWKDKKKYLQILIHFQKVQKTKNLVQISDTTIWLKKKKKRRREKPIWGSANNI